MSSFEYRIDDSVVDISLKSSPSKNDVNVWGSLAVEFLQTAFAGRTVWIASDDERAMSLRWLASGDSDEPREKVCLGVSTYSLWYVERPTNDILNSIVSSRSVKKSAPWAWIDGLVDVS